MSDVWDGLQRKARDHARNPAPHWDDSKDAGFSLGKEDAAKPWMRVHDDYKDWNVASQLADEDSVLKFWTRMVAFRKQHFSCVSLHPFTVKLFADSAVDLWSFQRVLTGR